MRCVADVGAPDVDVETSLGACVGSFNYASDVKSLPAAEPEIIHRLVYPSVKMSTLSYI